MSSTDSNSVAAFQVLFLDPSPTIEAVDGSVAELRALSVELFTAVAIEAITESGIAPHDTTICVKRRKLRKNVDSVPGRAWQFDVFVESGSDRQRVDRWLTTDRSWATTTGIQKPTLRRMTELERDELSDRAKVGLIVGRARRVMTWLHKPHGNLNAGVV